MADTNQKKGQELDSLEPVYLYISSSDSVLEDKVRGIKNFLKGKINLDTDFMAMSGGDDISEEEIENFTGTPSLFSPKKIMIINNINKAPVYLKNKIADIISSPGFSSSSITLILTSPRENFSKKLVSAVEKTGSVKRIKAPSAGYLRKWLKERSASDGISFTVEAEELLLENTNMEPNLLKKEYEKLYSYMISEEDRTIEEGTVRALVNRVHTLKIFDLVDCIGAKDKNGCILALEAVLNDGQNLIGLITLIHRMFKCFLYIKSGDGSSSVTGYIGATMSISPYFTGKMVNKYIRFSGNYTEDEIVEIFNILAEYDIAFRTGIAGDKNTAIKMIHEIIDIKLAD